MQNYQLCHGGDVIGSVRVIPEGLYRRLVCKCQLCGEVMYDLVAQCGSRELVIGLLSPQFDSYMLDKKIPAKELGQGVLSFAIRARHGGMKGLFVPVSSQSPFAYISNLEQGYLDRRGEHVGIVFPDKNSAENIEIKA